MTDSNEQVVLPPRKLAIILDGMVQDVLYTDERLGALFLSEPKVVDVTDWSAANPDKPINGMPFDSLGITQP